MNNEIDCPDHILEETVMKAIATASLRLQLPPQSGLAARLPDFIALMKPRIMMLAVFTAFVGLACAPRELDPVRCAVAMLAIAAGAGSAGVLNMWYDADIDAVMARTAMRPLPSRRVTPREAAVLGFTLGVAAVTLLAVATNLAAAVLLGGAILFYAVIYTAWLKRSTRHNIVIGGAAGALPPVIGWTAASGDIGPEPLALFLIIFLWTPPHFWALALNRAEEYGRAGVPMLPVVSGRAATTRQILIYSVLLVMASALPWLLGFSGAVYEAVAAICGTTFVVLAVRLNGANEGDRYGPRRLFVFSIVYLFVLFAAILVDHDRNAPSSIPTQRHGRIGADVALADPTGFRPDRGSIDLRADGV